MGKLGKTTLAAAVAAPFDPTGASLAVAVGGGASWVTRSAYRKFTGRSDTSGTEGNLDQDDIAHLRHIVRTITASTIGLGTSGALSMALPHYTVPAAINAGFLIYYVSELHRLATKAGGKRVLIRSIKTHQLVADIAVATAVKTVFLILFMGHDFDVLVNSIDHSQELYLGHMDTGVTPSVENLPASELAQWHAAVSENDLLQVTQGLADAPVTAFQEYMIGTDEAPVWGSEASHELGPLGTLFLGTVVAGVEQAVRIGAEDPSEKLVGRIQYAYEDRYGTQNNAPSHITTTERLY
ncbi:MAG: hypothetical protein M1823_000149 [Watsoniomyces obsoletus]|nr:MAG: hypothetical protein M1823_000149 [Watsoniomyces obsoletus]